MAYRSPYQVRPQLTELASPQQVSQDEELFARLRHDWRTASDVEEPVADFVDFTQDDLQLGSSHRYYMASPRYAEARGVIAMHEPFANIVASKMWIRAAVTAELTGHDVIIFPNNLYFYKNEYYTPELSEKIAAGDLSVISLRRMIIANRIAEERGFSKVHHIGWSEGGAVAAAAFPAAVKKSEPVGNVFAGDFPNVVKRRSLELIQAFNQAGGDRTYTEAVTDTGISALSEIMNLERPIRRKVGETIYGISALSIALNRAKIKGFGTGGFETDLGHIDRLPTSHALVAWGEDSPMTPNQEATDALERVESLPLVLGRVAHMAIRNAGHGDGDDVFLQAILARHAVMGLPKVA